MTTATALWSFALVVGLLTLTPGLDTALILRTSAIGHRRRAWGVVLGIQAGTLAWGSLTAVGLTAILTASHLAYETMRWVGAVYLVWLGARMLIATWRRRPVEEIATTADGADRDSLVGGFRQGLLTNLLNPKMGAFYVAVLPQFMPPGTNHLAMGLALTAEHIMLGLIWSTVLIGFARVLRQWLQQDHAKRILDRITGTVIAAFGLRLALGK